MVRKERRRERKEVEKMSGPDSMEELALLWSSSKLCWYCYFGVMTKLDLELPLKIAKHSRKPMLFRSWNSDKYRYRVT